MMFCNSVAQDDFVARHCLIDQPCPSDHKAVHIGLPLSFLPVEIPPISAKPPPAELKLPSRAFAAPAIVVHAIPLIRSELAQRKCTHPDPGV